MLYPRNIEEKLGFQKIRQQLEELCAGPGRSFVQKMRFSTRTDNVGKLVRQTAELVQVLQHPGDFPNGNYLEIESLLNKVTLDGSWLDVDELYELKRALNTAAACVQYFSGPKGEDFPELTNLSSQVFVARHLLDELDRVLNEKGQIADNASPDLRKIRQKLNAEQNGLRKRMETVFARVRSAGYVKDDLGPTLREGRLVLPVSSEHKSRVKGLIHDASSTGQTLFIEPEELLNHNNLIRELQLQERQEIIRILKSVAKMVRPQLPELHQAGRYIAMLDFIRAKARFAQQTEAILPEIVPETRAKWNRARHPLLYLHHKALKKAIVPQDILLDDEARILLISGPNAGGKSVTLKTVGLLQYMFQCGMLVSVGEGSTFGFFDDLFVELGDDQSLEDDLSTYSSHLTHMRFFMRKARAKTLCLIDEFGAGTEPELGGAIAESILLQLNRQQVFAVITTHYANLKLVAGQTKGIVNGAMRYDAEHLKPLYQLDYGQPGSSFAFEIAQNIGLPQPVIDQARKKAGKAKVHVEDLLRELEGQKQHLRINQLKLDQDREELEEQLRRYKFLSDYLEENKKRILTEAKTEAKQLLGQTNQKIENTIRKIKESQAAKAPTQEARQELSSFGALLEDGYKAQLVEKAVQPKKQKAAAAKPVMHKQPTQPVTAEADTPIAVGDMVSLSGAPDAIAEVLEISGKDAVIRMGQLKSTVKLKRLSKTSRRERKKQARAASTYSVGENLRNTQLNFSAEMDLRGKRAEEVLPLLEPWLDQARLVSVPELRIVHGKGGGVLRQLIRDYLRNQPDITSVADEHADRGGHGVTIIKLQ